MTTNPMTGATPPVETPPFQTSNSSQGASAKDPLGRDAFLNLLVTQLQHQDPTQPQADGEFLAQLATFSQLEQLQAMNKKIAELTDLIKNGTP